MRWMIAIMAAINLMILFWGVLRDDPGESSGVPVQPGAGVIRLLSESRPHLLDESAQVQVLEPEPVVEVSIPPEPAPDPAPKPKLDLIGQAPEVPEPAPASPPPARPAKPPVQPQIQPRVAQAPEPAPTNQVTPVCGRIGPFDDDAKARRAGRDLAELGFTVERQIDKSQKAIGFWVLIPPKTDLASARDSLEDLRRAGFKDIALITSGERANSVSLGYFSSRDNANKRVTQVRNKGFKAEMRENLAERSSTWLKVEGLVNQDDWRTRRQGFGQGVSYRAQPCR